MENILLPTTDDLKIKNGYAGWSNGKGKAIFTKTQNTDAHDAVMVGQRIKDFSVKKNILN